LAVGGRDGDARAGKSCERKKTPTHALNSSMQKMTARAMAQPTPVYFARIGPVFAPRRKSRKSERRPCARRNAPL
jgi:hypothetical protein